MSKQIVIIGSGHVATQLGLALHHNGHRIQQVYSRQLPHATALANLLDAEPVDQLQKLTEKADFYFICVTDQAIPTVIEHLPKQLKGIVAHTSGSTDMAVFPKEIYRYGVFYPVQTFNKSKAISFETIPLAIEAGDPETTLALKSLAQTLSQQVFDCDSTQRLSIHIAAVFACNFTNHLYVIAQRILQDQQLDFELIHPLIQETTQKALTNNPLDMQTGPAVREDYSIISKQQHFLTANQSVDPKIAELYDLLTELIIKSKKRP